MATSDDPLRQAAFELYGVPAEEFVATRKRLADAAEEKHTASAIKGLSKPAAAAAIVNAFVRSEPEALARLIEIGGRLRAAEEDGDANGLRALARERRQALADATNLAVTNAGSNASTSTRDAVEATLQASIIDPSAASATSSGLLVKALTPGADLDEPTALPVDERPRAGSPAMPDTRAKTSRTTAAAARKAQAAADQAEKRASEAEARLSEDEAVLDALGSERDELEVRLAEVRDELSRLEERNSSLSAELSAAQQSRRAAATAARRSRTVAEALRRKAQ